MAESIATVNWVYPASEEARIDGFRLYYGASSHSEVGVPDNLTDASPYDTVVEITSPTARETALELSPGTYFFRMTAYGVLGGEPAGSVFSEEVMGMIGFLSPSNVSISITLTVP